MVLILKFTISLIAGVSDCDVIYIYGGEVDLSIDFLTLNAGTYPSSEFVATGAVNFADGSAAGAPVKLTLIDEDNFSIDLGTSITLDNEFYIQLNSIDLKDGTYVMVATTVTPEGEKLRATDSLVIDSSKAADLDLLNFSGVEFKEKYTTRR